jgi:acid phosphatase
MHRAVFVLVAVALGACAHHATKQSPAPSAAPAAAAGLAPDDQRQAIAWMQTSTEFGALCETVFAQATRVIREAAAQRTQYAAIATEINHGAAGSAHTDAQPAGRADRLDSARAVLRAALDGGNALAPNERAHDSADEPLAIIADVDETLLDNTPYQIRLARTGTQYTEETWQQWSNERNARALPGAAAFAQEAARLGVTLFYVTNRQSALTAATADNLRAQGFPVPDDNRTVLTRDDARGWGKDKGSRRRYVDEQYRVVALLGDNLGDFIDGVYVDNIARAQLIEPYRDWWGTRWFMLPNPAYGSWMDAVTKYCPDPALEGKARECLDAWLRDR